MNQARPRRIAVLGGGLTGLAAAYELRRRSSGRQPQTEVVLFEADTRVGGKIRSERHDGVLYESGPESFGAAGPQVMELVRELGLGGEVLHPDPRHRSFLVLSGGKLKPLPEGMARVVPDCWWSFLRSDLLTWKGKLRFLAEPFLMAEEGEGDESLAGFFGRRLGPEAVERLVEPILAGACLGDPARLSVRSMFPHLADLERRGLLPK